MSRYIILDKGWYRPGFTREDGTLAGLNGHGFGFIGAYSIQQVGDIQKKLVALSWQVSAADAKTWDAIWATLQGKVIPGSAAPFTGWGWTRDEIVRRGSKLLVTPSYTPSDDLVSAAVAFVADVDAMIAYYKKISPESSGAVESAKAEVNQKLAQIGSLQDPSDVFWQSLINDLKDKVKGGLPWGLLALAVGGAFVASKVLR
jgi:hypothetical protein